MASPVSGQDEPNPALWLATRAGKMGLSYPLVTTRCIPQGKFPLKPCNKSFIGQVCSVKMAGYWPRSSSRSINTQKRTWLISSHLDLRLGQWPIFIFLLVFDGEVVSWWRVRWWRNSLISRWPDPDIISPSELDTNWISCLRLFFSSPFP